MTIPLIIYWVNLSLEWNSYTIGESCELITGFPFKSKYYLNDGAFKVVRGDNVKEGFIKWDDKKRCWNELNDKLKKVILKEEDIVIGMDGSKLGKNRATISKKDLPALLAQRVACVRAKEGFDQNYIKYVILSNYFKSYVDKVKTGTSIPHISLGQISEFTFQAPDYKKQKIISNILSNIDKKITVNQEININLLSIADAIFKKEFRNFDEYLEGDLISSDFGLIPKNWYYKTLDEISDVAIGKTPTRKETWWFSEKEGVKWVSIKDLGNSGTYIFETSEYLTEEAIDKFNVKLIPEDTVILSFKLTVGRLGITTEEMTTNEAIAHFKLDSESPISKEYLYLYLKNFNYEELGSTSSIAKAINSKIVKKIPILVPESNKLNEFKELFENIFNEIKSNQIEINNLTKLRDTLLPKLMSGEIDVSKINCDMQQISTNNWDNKFTVPLQNNLITVIS